MSRDLQQWWRHVWGNFMFTCLLVYTLLKFVNTLLIFHEGNQTWHWGFSATKSWAFSCNLFVISTFKFLEYRIFTRDFDSIDFQQFMDIQNCVKKFLNFSSNFWQLLRCLEKWKSSHSFIRLITLKLLAPVVLRLDSAIHEIKLYPSDSVIHPLHEGAFREKSFRASDILLKINSGMKRAVFVLPYFIVKHLSDPLEYR